VETKRTSLESSHLSRLDPRDITCPVQADDNPLVIDTPQEQGFLYFFSIIRGLALESPTIALFSPIPSFRKDVSAI